jgi:hypothetical protein
MEPRWEGDGRGHGIADGRRLSSEIDEFRRTVSSPDWVAEAPEVHLLPHLTRACGGPDANFALASTEVASDGTFLVTLRAQKALSRGQIRASLFALIGQIAETTTYIRQRPADVSSPDPAGDIVYEVATGIRSGDGPFAPHGHLVRFRVQPATGL